MVNLFENNILFENDLLLEKSLKQSKKDYIQALKKELDKSDVKVLKQVIDYINQLNKKKGMHSLDVSKQVARYTDNIDTILGALFHDYIERGGNIDKLPISKKAKKIVKFLSSETKDYSGSENEPLEHLMEVIPEIKNENLKNNVILVKLMDRYDNLKRRGKALSKKYIHKTKQLFHYLAQHFTGKKKILLQIAKAMAQVIKQYHSKKQAKLTI